LIASFIDRVLACLLVCLFACSLVRLRVCVLGGCLACLPTCLAYHDFSSDQVLE
jgi:hypothetical protein